MNRRHRVATCTLLQAMIACLGAFGVAGSVNAAGPVRFDRDVQPVLTKAGCNQGACHGSQYGKGGFKLSLRGFDVASDYYEIVKASKGRRVAPIEPTASLLLTKPSLEIAHKGGNRLPKGSTGYEIVRRWIDSGAQPPPRSDEPLAGLSIEPTELLLQPGQQVALKATAKYQDGTVEDVAGRATFDSLSATVATTTAEGTIAAKSRGDTAIMVRYLDKVAVCRVIVPFGESVGLDKFVRANFVDECLTATWKKLGLAPAEDAPDTELLRRLHLDAIGTLPTPERIRAYLADRSPNKWAAAVDEVLARPEYVDYWAHKWGDLLRVNRELIGDKGMWTFHNFLRGVFRDNRPMDELAEALLTASGSPAENGAANFFQVGRQPVDWAENAAQVLLGTRMQCAKCHHHPFENISQSDYYGLAACFARLGAKPGGESGVYGRDNVIFVRDSGEIRHPRTGQIVPPHAPGSAALEDPLDRRRALARWLRAADNPALARNLANRYWGYLMGRGLVDPIDDLRVTNPASSPELLDRLAGDLIAHKYDLKHLLRTILNSHVYRLSSASAKASEVDAENRYFTHYTAKRLSAEQLLDAIDFACGTREKFAQLPASFRAISLPDNTVRSRFMDAFGRPRREMACECERSDLPNMTQALELMTGSFLNAKVSAGGGRVRQWFAAKRPLEKMVEDIYLVTVSRPPNAEEALTALQLVRSAKQPREAVEDLLWTMLNAREFQFCH